MCIFISSVAHSHLTHCNDDLNPNLNDYQVIILALKSVLSAGVWYQMVKITWCLHVIYRVIIWECILNKRLVRLCIDRHRETLYTVRTPNVGHFICDTKRFHIWKG